MSYHGTHVVVIEIPEFRTECANWLDQLHLAARSSFRGTFQRMFYQIGCGREPVSQALNNEPLTVFGDGSQSRSFCYVSDLIEGILRLAMSEYHSPVNIGNPVEMTIKQFAQKILEITGATGGIIYTDLPVDDPKVRRSDIARARALLGWQPKVDFDKGIRLTIDYFQSSRSQR
jgi:nucleoside-diphosphate-sugar epimerase